MVIATLQFELIIRHSTCLKDKRRVVSSVKERLQRKYRVSVAEIGALDHHRIALLGLAAVTNSARHGAEIIDRVINTLREEREAELGDLRRNTICGTPPVIDEEAGEPALSDIETDELRRMGEEVAARLTGPRDPERDA